MDNPQDSTGRHSDSLNTGLPAVGVPSVRRMKSVRDRLGELVRPTGEEDLMRVEYPAPRFQVSPRQAGWAALVLAGIVIVAILARLYSIPAVPRPGEPIGEPDTVAGTLAESAGSAKPAGQAVPIAGEGIPVLPLGESTASGPGTDEGPDDEIVVSVVGHVAHPGLVVLQPGARVADALAKADVLEGSDPRAVNLARILSDGEQLVIPAPGEELIPGAVGEPSVQGVADAGTLHAAGQPGASSGGGKVSINTAGVAELVTLNGVGEVTAEAIVAHREAHGPFASVESLTEVRGIGPAKMENLKDQVTL